MFFHLDGLIAHPKMSARRKIPLQSPSTSKPKARAVFPPNKHTDINIVSSCVTREFSERDGHIRGPKEGLRGGNRGQKEKCAETPLQVRLELNVKDLSAEYSMRPVFLCCLSNITLVLCPSNGHHHQRQQWQPRQPEKNQ